MAEFLTTSGVTYHLERLIKDAKERLVLVSPYLKINDRLRQLLEDQDRFKIDIRVVYGKNELQPEENNWLRSKASIRSSYCKNLHAKCFLNESETLITSMNLYEFSQVNNEEMGILVKREEDPTLYDSVYQEAMRLIRISEELQVEVKEVAPKSTASANGAGRSKGGAPKEGVCIRCAAVIKADPTHPYCKDCYAAWKKQHQDSDHLESNCHLCGAQNKSTLNKPTCYACYRKHNKVLTFPLAQK